MVILSKDVLSIYQRTVQNNSNKIWYPPKCITEWTNFHGRECPLPLVLAQPVSLITPHPRMNKHLVRTCTH